MAFQDLALVGVALRLRHSDAIPFVRVLGRDPQGAALARTADQDRWLAPGRLRLIVRSIELVEATRERSRALGPERAHHPHGLVEPVEALLERWEGNAVRAMLGLVPAGAQPHDEATAAEEVQLGSHAGIVYRAAKRDRGDQGAEAVGVRFARGHGEGQLRFERLQLPRAGEVVVGPKERGEAKPFRERSDMQPALPREVVLALGH